MLKARVGIPKKFENIRHKNKGISKKKLRIFVKKIYRVRHRNEGIPNEIENIR